MTPTELASCAYFFIINVQFMDIKVVAKFDEIPPLPVQDIKEKPKCCSKQEKQG